MNYIINSKIPKNKIVILNENNELTLAGYKIN